MFNGKIHSEWWISMAMLNYQRVHQNNQATSSYLVCIRGTSKLSLESEPKNCTKTHRKGPQGLLELLEQKLMSWPFDEWWYSETEGTEGSEGSEGTEGIRKCSAASQKPADAQPAPVRSRAIKAQRIRPVSSIPAKGAWKSDTKAVSKTSQACCHGPTQNVNE